ncbi:hypothetical protein Pmar_PMAR008593 [Perkinsus marinus ATCC 50983]|uniref:LicD/FKTN/FKRP nucleotidyltransferase domain-containing protein n=1 Tax=Perkinsus marinus (strain ATCC 50983 / TXsc) TaxID=423536 RepID=C5L7X9_PERM5|nr:hypothetical protein Pmar_PMAR008593 [Perkinsus marinus ATCC 50983]EER07159.1 hypothetical protein Pmar_PMAR008593 [Perkinsus marinus ATCC 50983]|eukprot:XP_002775343.1 hypothetical protein Pmar_PMAR008593 [Perkinsus marinus ATCC 50983]
MSFLWVLLLTVEALLTAVFASSAAHPFIRVYAEQNPISAPLEHLFLCPAELKDKVDLSQWPRYEVTIDGSNCSSHKELLAEENRAQFFQCLTDVVNITTHAMDTIGLSPALSDGTLLGWYRHHKGYIPWDVDADTSIMKADCRESFKKYAKPEHKNIAQVLQERMPDDKHFRVRGIKYMVGSELKDDDWEGCENPEFRVVHSLNGSNCHVDIFQMLQSTDPEAPCTTCPGYSDGAVTVCRTAEGRVCGLKSDYEPSTWDRLDWGDCKIPNNPVGALESQYPGPGIELNNFKLVPGNYKYGSQMLVVGRPVDANGNEISDAAPPAAAPSLRGSDDSKMQEVLTNLQNLVKEGWSGGLSRQYEIIVLVALALVCAACLICLGVCICKRHRTVDELPSSSAASAYSDGSNTAIPIE